MNLSKYQCLICLQSKWQTYSTIWKCEHCGHTYSCANGIPKLYVESEIGQQDKVLRDYFYDGFLGSYYQYVMPFLSLPVRPAAAHWKAWAAYALIVSLLLAVIGYLTSLLVFPSHVEFSVVSVVAILLFSATCYFFYRHPYLLFLILLAIPVRISVLLNRFRPNETFTDIHSRVIEELLQRKEKLHILDISTGTCNSLYRHGWMKLNADYTGLDLSEMMLSQGQKFMAQKQVPMDFVLADAGRLPFQSESFNVVLSYGAINGLADTRRALAEMERVTKRGGFVLFLDEQLYESASFIERFYFKTVLSSHNVIHHCPVEMMPPGLGSVKVHQVYQFYYICTSQKT